MELFAFHQKKQLSILLNFFLLFIDIRCSINFFSSLKLQYCRTFILLNMLKLLKKPLFQKRRWSCDFPSRKLRLHKSTARFPVKKRWHSPCPLQIALGLPSPQPHSLYGRTLASQPKFLASIAYHISLPIVFRSAAFGREGAPLLILVGRIN